MNNKRYQIQLADDPLSFTTRNQCDMLLVTDVGKFSRDENLLFFLKDRHSHQDNSANCFTNEKVFFDPSGELYCMGENGVMRCTENENDEYSSSNEDPNDDSSIDIIPPAQLQEMAEKISNEVGQILSSQLRQKKDVCAKGRAGSASSNWVTSSTTNST